MTAPVRTRYRVSGMDCAACDSKVDTAVRRLPGVEDVSVSVSAGTMLVQHQPDPSLFPAMRANLKSLGYDVTRINPEGEAGNDNTPPVPWWRSQKGLLTLACGLALLAAYGIGHLVPATEGWASLVALLIGLLPVARRAFMAARAGSPFSIETLMTVAAVGALFIGATEEAAMVVFLFLVGELLEGVAAGQARASIQGLTALVPKIALIEERGQTREVPAESLVVGNLILVRPGDRVPADGVVEGESTLDEAPVTGESVPKPKTAQNPVFAGTVNGDGALRVRVTAAAAETPSRGWCAWSRRPRRAKPPSSASSTASPAPTHPASSLSLPWSPSSRRCWPASPGANGSTRVWPSS